MFEGKAEKRRRKEQDLRDALRSVLPLEEKLKEEVRLELISPNDFDRQYKPIKRRIYDLYLELLKLKKADRSDIVEASLDRIKELKYRVASKSAKREKTQEDIQRIKNKINGLDLEIADLKSELEGRRPEKKIKIGEDPKTFVPNLFFIVPILLVLLAVALSIQYYTTLCPKVGLSSNMFRIIELLTFIEERSPKDHDMVCSYVEDIDYTMGSVSKAFNDATVRLTAEGVLSPSKTDSDEIFKSSVIIHEACHIMMRTIQGGHGGLIEKDVERPCVRMQYMYMYRAGMFGDTEKSYLRMVEDLKGEQYGAKILLHTQQIPKVMQKYQEDKIYKRDASVEEYCSRTSLNVELIDGPESENASLMDLNLENNGSSIIHCGFIELLADSMEYPLDCWELAPGQEHQTGKNFHLSKDQTVDIRVVGCENQTYSIKEGEVKSLATAPLVGG
ncbi:MAG: hypothetical protein ABH950_02190 [Candidatus Altiarchaeota archaeon]